MSKDKSKSTDETNVLRGSQIPVPTTNNQIASTSGPRVRQLVGPEVIRPEIDLNKDPPPDPDGMVWPGAIRPEIDLNKDPPLDPDLDLHLNGLHINQAPSQQNRPGNNNSTQNFNQELIKAIQGNIDESRRCECPAPNCINLNCPCFSTAMYCGVSCVCTGCVNRNKYDYIVDLASVSILADNPLAFAPKGFRRDTRPIVVEKGLTEPSASSSETRKSRCSCKTDKCTRNYCGCFKYKMGCSGECKCVGCRNIYGVK